MRGVATGIFDVQQRLDLEIGDVFGLSRIGDLEHVALPIIARNTKILVTLADESPQLAIQTILFLQHRLNFGRTELRSRRDLDGRFLLFSALVFAAHFLNSPIFFSLLNNKLRGP